MIKIGICGYGNLGKGVAYAISQTKDLELVAVFTRRDLKSIELVTKDVPVHSIQQMILFKDKIDVIILCGGSATDLPHQSPEVVKNFNIVDSFDTHAKISEHFSNVHSNAMAAQKVAIIAVGWDPGMFSLNRCVMEAVLPHGKDYTFWGKGVSQGHSDAIRRISGVVDARQYTIPIEKALEEARSGSCPSLTTREKHLRECFVVAEKSADLVRIETEIKTMPNYFDEYKTIVHFITKEELLKNHNGIPHGGFVIRSGATGADNKNKHVIEYRLKLDSNPEFTASVLVAYARAAHRLYQEKQIGCKTVLDIAPKYISENSYEELMRTIL